MKLLFKILFASIIFLIITSTDILCQRSYNIRKLPFNTPLYGEYAPVFYKNGIAFCSNRRNEVFTVTTTQNNEYLTDLYMVKSKSVKKWEEAKLFSKEITSNSVAGPMSISKDGNTLYFTKTKGIINRTEIDTSKENFFGIFIADWDGTKWINIRPFEHNPDSFNCGYPFMSKDETTLYFSSNKPGGYGRYDIYSSGLNSDGSFSEPQNLGNIINTAGSEIYPFYHMTGRLYFSSDGHAGRGGMDLYYSDYADGEWKEPINLQAPFNTRNNDFALIINATLDTGYFSTDRFGSDDIVYFFSGLPTFTQCKPQVEDEWCYRIFEEGSIDLDTATFQYEWDLGDGTKIRGLEANHCFEGPATYVIKLNVIDTLTGEIHFNEATYQLFLEKTEQPYISVVDTGIVNNEIEMDALQTNLKDFIVDRYIWDFGDGVRTRNQVVRHAYRRPGTYTIKLGVINKLTNIENTLPEKVCVSKNIVIVRRRN
jgi:hypothetical protein